MRKITSKGKTMKRIQLSESFRLYNTILHRNLWCWWWRCTRLEMLKREIVGYSTEHSLQAAARTKIQFTISLCIGRRPAPGTEAAWPEQEPDFCEEESLHPKNRPPQCSRRQPGPEPQKSVTLK